MSAPLDGTCAAPFEAVRDQFATNLATEDELGASVAVVHNGEMVVDLWGGWSDTEQTIPWQSDTITNVWSTTKTMAALSAMVLVDRGELDLFRPVADYWPEFAANGKDAIDTRHLMSHTSGLSGWNEPITAEEVCDWEKSTSMLAAQAPWWEPGTASGYHALTHGHLIGEVVRRITGQSIGTFFAAEIAGPLGADFHIGVPTSELGRVVDVVPPTGSAMDDMDPRPTRDSVLVRTFVNPMMSAKHSWNDWWRQAEIPAANGHGNARAVATIQAVVANGGEMNGVRLLSPETIELFFAEHSNGMDQVLAMPIRFGAGYALASPTFPMMREGRTCFWGGWGGSLVIIDADRQLTIAYMMNKMGVGMVGDDRGTALIDAAYTAIGQM